MGVSLSGLVSSQPLSIDTLSGKSVAIDAYNTLYQFLASIRDRLTGEPLRDSHGRITSHLSGLFYRTSRLLEAGVKPVFVFDGAPPAFKLQTIEERRKIRAEAEVKWKAAVEQGDLGKVKTYAQASSRLTSEMIEEAKQLLTAMGVGWVQAPSEGEAQAAFMAAQGTVWAAGSQDWDSLLFGAPRLARNLTLSGKRKLPGREKYVDVEPEMVVLEDALRALSITRDQLIIIGLLVGTDFNPGVKGVGPKTALKLVKEHRTLEQVMRHADWNFGLLPEVIFDFFKEPPARDLPINRQPLNQERLLHLLVAEHGFSEDRVMPVVKKLTETARRGQASLGSFFGGK